MSAKGKRVVLSVNNKYKIFDCLKKVKMASALASEFNVGKSTITYINRSELTLIFYRLQLESF